MGNTNKVTSVCVKFNSDRLYIDRDLGYFQKSDNNKTRPRTTFAALEDPFRVLEV